MHVSRFGLVFVIATLLVLTHAISFTYGVQDGDVALYQNEVLDLSCTKM